MTDNEEIQFQLTLGHLENFDIPFSALENVDLTNAGVQRAILDCLTRDQMVNVLADQCEEVANNGH